MHLTQHSVVIHHQLLLHWIWSSISSWTGAISHQPWGTASTIRKFSTSRHRQQKDRLILSLEFVPSKTRNVNCLSLCVDWFGEMMFIHTFRNLANAHIHTYYSHITYIYIYDTRNTTYHWRYIPMDPVKAPHIKHTCIIVMYDSIAAQRKKCWVSSLTVLVLPHRFISPFGIIR